MSRLKSIQDPRVQAVLTRWPLEKKFHKSPEAWEDQLMYFLLPDRFSDGNEQGYRDIQNNLVTSGSTPLFNEADRENATRKSKDREEWLSAGGKFLGGTVKGVISKLGYLKRMGVSAIWIGPIFKQVAKLETYHGYGIQDFLDVDPRFGTREELREMVRAAHDLNIYILLDVILNHSGDVFAYKDKKVHYTGKPHEVRGFWDADRNPQHMLPLAPVDERNCANPSDAAIWPVELQSAGAFSRKGTIRDFDASPEYLEGDFFGLKSFDLGRSDPNNFNPSSALNTLCEAFKFWLTFLDLDGFRVVSSWADLCSFHETVTNYAFNTGHREAYGRWTYPVLCLHHTRLCPPSRKE
jgi:glycosidase